VAVTLDIRLPIGLLFTFIGGLLAATGWPAINVNLWWGLAMLLFGVWFLYLARRRARQPR
jgi:hypothetical protein